MTRELYKARLMSRLDEEIRSTIKSEDQYLPTLRWWVAVERARECMDFKLREMAEFILDGISMIPETADEIYEEIMEVSWNEDPDCQEDVEFIVSLYSSK